MSRNCPGCRHKSFLDCIKSKDDKIAELEEIIKELEKKLEMWGDLAEN